MGDWHGCGEENSPKEAAPPLVNRDNLFRSAKFVRVVDGDTFTAMIDLAPTSRPRPWLEANIRVADWNAAELSEEEGPYMREQFENILKGASTVVLGLGPMSFSRIVCHVYINDTLFAGLLTHSLMQFRRRMSDGKMS